MGVLNTHLCSLSPLKKMDIDPRDLSLGEGRAEALGAPREET